MAGWGHTDLIGLTQNRTHRGPPGRPRHPPARGQGHVGEDPGGVDRHDRPRRRTCCAWTSSCAAPGRSSGRPIGAYSTFADHGTVVEDRVQAYIGRSPRARHGDASAPVRDEGKVPASRPMVNVFSNGDEGDQSAGLNHCGPRGANYVGRVEAGAMLRAWRDAGTAVLAHARARPRWTAHASAAETVEDGQQVDTRTATGMRVPHRLRGRPRAALRRDRQTEFEGSAARSTTGGLQGDKVIFPACGRAGPRRAPRCRAHRRRG